MTNLEKLYFTKQAGFKRLLSGIMGSRGTVTPNVMTIRPPSGIGGAPFEMGSTLHGASGLKGLSRMKFQQLGKAPSMKNHNNLGFSQGYAMNPEMTATPLANLLKALALGAGAGGIGYGAYKGMEADSNLGPPYNYDGNPNSPE